MKFCMVTTFFGQHSFGGDAAYVERLCQALCRRGHEVHVYYCVDAFNAVRGSHPLREYTPAKGLYLHPPVSALRAGAGGGPAPPRGASPSRPSSTAAWSGARSTAPRPWSPRTCLPSSLARGSCWRARPRTGSKAV